MSAALEEKEEDGVRYDAIFIGSGIGSMTTAVALAREKGWRCLLLEQVRSRLGQGLVPCACTAECASSTPTKAAHPLGWCGQPVDG